MERLIPINITKAKIEKIALTFSDSDKELNYNAEVTLIDDYGKHITSIYISNGGWNKDDRAKITPYIIDLAGKIRAEVEVQVIRHINKQQRTLEHKE